MKEVRKLTKMKRAIYEESRKTNKDKIEPSIKEVRKLTKINRTIHQRGNKTNKDKESHL